MNRRLFLQSSAIIAAPAFVSATGIYRGVVGLISPVQDLVVLDNGIELPITLERWVAAYSAIPFIEYDAFLEKS